jgi:hypothetical protein
MKNRFSGQRNPGGGSWTRFAFYLGIAGLLSLVILGAALCGLRPSQPASVTSKRLPANQLQADLRTLAAAAHFLMDSGSDEAAGQPVAFSRAHSARLQPGLPQFAQSGDPSNHVEFRVEPPATHRASSS